MNYNQWTEKEDKELVSIVNDNLIRHSKRPVQWKGIKAMDNHSISSMKSRWSHVLNPRCEFDGYKYILRGSTLFDAPRVSKKKDKPKTTPVNKRVKVSRSLFWGLVKVTRYE